MKAHELLMTLSRKIPNSPRVGELRELAQDQDVIEEMNKLLDLRDRAVREAFQILWDCRHGDEATCGCRARALIATPGRN